MRELNFAYHDVAPRRPGDRYTIDAATFERHVEAIASGGPNVRVTVDDGLRSSSDVIAPILERYGLRGTFFVITSGIGHHRCMDPALIRELHAAGHTIGSHTHTHPRNPYLKDLPDERVIDEWRESKAVLEDILGETVTLASTPYGFYVPRLARLAAAEGYTGLYISTPRTEAKAVGGLLVHGRFGVTVATSVDRVAALARGAHGAIFIEQAAWCARHAAKSALGPLWLTVRGALLARRHA